MNQSTKKYAFVLGREQEICLEELKSVLKRFCFCFSIYRISGNVVFANIDNLTDDDAQKIINVTAGTIKIYQLVDSLANDISAQIVKLISDRKANQTGKINFGVSCFNSKISRQQINSFALTAKKKLKGKYSLRYVESRDDVEISSILTLKNNLLDKGIEFGLFDEEIGVLVALNNPEEWNKRDYGKPASDKFSGMLPPKLARMLVNLALGQVNSKLDLRRAQIALSNSRMGETRNSKQIQNNNDRNSKHISDFGFRTSDLKQSIIIDCFCGSGNILLEAIMLGCDVVGSDISSKAVKDSQANCSWLSKNYRLPTTNYRLFQADATSNQFIENCKLKIENYDNVVVVTEPYLGEPKKYKPSRSAAIGEYKKVGELYFKFLKNIAKLLNCSIASGQESAPGTNNNSITADGEIPSKCGTIEQFNNCALCLVFPLVETSDGGRYSLFSDCVDQIKKMGYTQTRSTFVYGREYQVVKREIVQLKLAKI